MVGCSVIVPVFNGENIIGACIESLLKQDYDKNEYEIIIVDDGSVDNTRNIIQRYSNVVYLFQENQGPAQARNYGARHAKGKIVLFTDADCRPWPDWIKMMIVPFENSDVAGVKGIYSSGQKEWVAKYVQFEYQMKYIKMQKNKHIDFIDTYSAAFVRDVFMKTGGYDKVFPNASVEDQEFSFRLANLGYKMRFQPAAVVDHYHSNTFKKYLFKKYKIAFWKVLVLIKHPNKLIKDSHTPQNMKYQIVLACLLSVLFFMNIFIKELIIIRVMIFSAVVFLISSAHEIKWMFIKNKKIGMVSPVVIFLRSVFMGYGLIKGLFSVLIEKIRYKMS